ncbi:endonuclease Q family protein [Gracilibacillus sp. YIM 98692]|uniref:endonuclease Q family protein n=1 Tax=Gracilibacillus sp. YIM 98692 TaxID=2663532 RepID=UPI0013D32CC6|nr:endonuclease Q family protein [Gracilibacillus sp. YIM 98692]
MKSYFVDLHIHIGRNIYHKPVKITASKNLTLTNIMLEASENKGMDMVGVIDCHAPAVQTEIKKAIQTGNAREIEGGGIRFDRTTLILGSELEIYDDHCKGPIHVLCYFRTLSDMERFSEWLQSYMKNIELSSQRFYGSAVSLQQKVRELNGLFIPAHVFTPFKSLYGKGVNKSLTEVLDSTLIDAIELGLSSDTDMADQIKELHSFPYLTNSDAHSLAKIAREYQVMQFNSPCFDEWKLALKEEGQRKIVANYGMNPRLGKYYATVCKKCFSYHNGEVCSECQSSSYIKGVSDRIKEISSSSINQSKRPPYIYQVPLEYIPGLGHKTYQKLLDHFGNEMNIIHFVKHQHLVSIVGQPIADRIIDLRNGRLSIEKGGGGKYGKVKS